MMAVRAVVVDQVGANLATESDSQDDDALVAPIQELLVRFFDDRLCVKAVLAGLYADNVTVGA